MTVRPTLRCLIKELGLPTPPAEVPLDEVDHPLLRKAAVQLADPAGTRERISAIDDTVFFKIKLQRWRGAAWIDESGQAWLVAAGQREEGSKDDFYESLATAARTARTRYNSEHSPPVRTNTLTNAWLPNDGDRDRLLLEAGLRFARELKSTVHRLTRKSLLDGHEHADEIGGAVLGIQVRAEDGHETHVALRVIGSVPNGLLVTVLASVPGCDRNSWDCVISMPDRPPGNNEQVWFNLMDPAAAAELLADDFTA